MRRSIRLSKDKEKTAVRRDRETSDQRMTRLSKKKEKTTKARDNETPEQRDRRLAKDRRKTAEGRAIQTHTIQSASKLFQDKIKEGPTCVCSVCHRLMFRKSVVRFYQDSSKYNKIPTDEKTSILNNLHNNSSWICNTCHITMTKGRMPAQAKANGLQLADVPEELQNLRPLELRLISQRIPFMKLVGLPKGQQRAIHGPAVNVPAKLENVCSLLPRLPGNAQVLPMKLKRKLIYTGHYMYDFIRPKQVTEALVWLKTNNPLYKDVTFCEDWQQQWLDGDSELWEAMINSNSPEAAGGDSPISTDTDNDPNDINRLAERHGHVVEDVPRDGNCFFSAMHVVLNKVGIHCGLAHEIRREVVTYLQTAKDVTRYQPCIPDAMANHQPAVGGHDVEQPEEVDFDIARISDPVERQTAKWNRYVDRLANGAWADNVAIQALADMMDIDIEILGTLNPDTLTVIHPAHSITPQRPSVTIGLIGQSHYVALHKINTHEDGHHMYQNTSVDTSTTSTTIKSTVMTQQEKEDAEDEAAFKDTSATRGLPYTTCMQEDSLQDSENIYSLAPGENQCPRAFLTDEDFELLANPEKYPDGRFGYSFQRKKNLTVRKYFNQRLLDADGRFAKDVDYLFAAQYVVEAKQIRDDASIALRQTRGQMMQGGQLNAGVVKNAANMASLFRTDSAYKFLKNVRGSPAYWQRVLYDLLAMVRQLGTPTWFLTLSAADMHWPKIIQSIGRQYGCNFTADDIAGMSWQKKCEWLNTNPVTAARLFQYRLEVFFKDFICSTAHPIGEVEDYFIRVEFQARGSPHAHTVLWVKDAPRIDEHPDEVVCQFIDKYQTCELTDDSARFQQHKHSPTCRRNGGCRFNYPRPPSRKTIIARPLVTDDANVDTIRTKSNEALQKVKTCLDDPTTPTDIDLDDLFKRAGVAEVDYTKELSETKSGMSIILKRDPISQVTNSHNKDLLHSWQANLDLQYITDPYACIMYVTSYMMKSEKAMSELLRKTAMEITNEDVKTQLRKLGATFLNHREVSAQEAAYRLLSLPLKSTTRTVLFISTSPKEKRVSMLKSASVLADMKDDDEDIFETSLNDRYAARPTEIETMCLAEFGSTFAVAYGETANPKQERIVLQNSLGAMYRRQRPAIIRFHREKEEGESKYRHLLMLYHPWRSEDELMGSYESYGQHYEAVKQVIQCKEDLYTVKKTGLHQALNDVQEMGPPEHAWDMLAPGAQQQQAEQEAEGVHTNRNIDPEDLQHNADLHDEGNQSNMDRYAELHARYTAEAKKSLLTPDEYREMMRTLNSKQRDIVDYHRQWCKETVIALKGQKPLPTYRLFVSGPGGVGKSHIIKLIHYETVRLLKLSLRFGPEDVIVLLTSFTGVAAFNIDGLTLHSAFLLETGNKGHEYRSLGSDKINTLRSRLSNLRLIIIDEISMVGADILVHVHRRLEDIMGGCSDTTFGNVSILAVGDLYQLQPVLQNHVFETPKGKYPQLYGSLWQESFNMVELSESMRQHEDKPFADMLNRVRTASYTSEDISMLKSRSTSNSDPTYPNDALHVFTTNPAVNEYNKEKLQQLTTETITIQCQDYRKDRQTGQLDLNPSSKPSQTGGLRPELSVAIGARVMVTVNIDVADGLVNGACGTVVDIMTNQGQPHAILVEFDSDRVGKKALASSQYKRTHPRAVPIYRHEVTFPVTKGRSHIQMTRRQFALTLCWACTIHKCQGKTLDKIVVCMSGKGPFTPGQVYVAFSRVRKLEDLFIVGFRPETIKCNAKVTAEMARLSSKSMALLKTPAVTCQSTSIIFLNVLSYLKHLEDLKSTECITDADITCFAETYLTPRHSLAQGQRITPEMSYIERQDRQSPSDRKGGLMVMSHSAMTRLHEPGITLSAIEYMCVRVPFSNTTIQLCVVYCKPPVKQSILLQDMLTLVNTMDNTTPIMICGDFNVDLQVIDNSPLLLQTMVNLGFRQLVSDPTTDYGSLLDHVYINRHLHATANVIDCYFSDHDIISVKVSRAI
ncbi:uncharacterized protein [Branchiostoma lanceolatum]|uniref:uncharacterized protein n=1 Tax=Branchiostoma lanceolatum TaxID=7740 RepID=UPI0034511AE5